MSFNEMLGRQFDWHGEATRFQFFKVWLSGTALSVLSFLPFIVYYWKLIEDAIDYGADAAMLMMMEDGVDPTVWVLLIFWEWMACWVLTGMFVMVLMATVRRLAHMGWSRWCVIIASVPLINILFLLILFFWPGRKRVSQTEAQEPV